MTTYSREQRNLEIDHIVSAIVRLKTRETSFTKYQRFAQSLFDRINAGGDAPVYVDNPTRAQRLAVKHMVRKLNRLDGGIYYNLRIENIDETFRCDPDYEDRNYPVYMTKRRCILIHVTLRHPRYVVHATT